MKAVPWIATLLVCIAAVAIVVLPVVWIQPFAAQSAAMVQWSHAFRQLAPLVTLAAVATVVLTLAGTWRRRGAWARAALLAMATVAVLAAWFARQNHFEWMFRPLPDARFTALADATGVDDDELVIAVANGGAALAFPVRRIGYHHLVNTVLAGEPIVATY
jgi:hypothetical protein